MTYNMKTTFEHFSYQRYVFSLESNVITPKCLTTDTFSLLLNPSKDFVCDQIRNTSLIY